MLILLRGEEREAAIVAVHNKCRDVAIFWGGGGMVSKRAAMRINLDLHAIKSGTEIFLFILSFREYNKPYLDGLSGGNMWQAGKKKALKQS